LLRPTRRRDKDEKTTFWCQGQTARHDPQEFAIHKLLAALVAFAAVILSTLFGFGATSTADATVNYIAWPKDVIYVYDMTAGIKKSDGTQVWPVRAAAARWATGNPVDFRYTTKGCPANSQCVIVRQGTLGAPAVGVTVTTTVGQKITSSKITLDKTFGRTNDSAHRRNVVCHELGHSLGLKHRIQTSSCLTPYVTSERYPDATDIRNLNTMYR
jgi:hypothetical protein